MADRRARTLAVVISLFRPDDETLQRVAMIGRLVDLLVVVDDSGAPDPRVLSRLGASKLIVNGTNRGLAYSLNVGIKRAMELGATHVMTLDQDTDYDAALAARLLDAFEASTGEFVAASSAQIVAGARLTHQHTWSGGICSFNVLQSGLIFNVEIFLRIGFFAECLFIDGIEPEFVMRMHAQGYHLSVVPGTVLRHDIGFPRVLRIGSRTLTLSGHSPVRRYYMVRNHLAWTREYRALEPEYCAYMRRWVAGVVIKSIFLEPGRLRNTWACLRGYIDYKSARFGRAPTTFA